MPAKKSKSHIGTDVGMFAAGAVAATAGALFLYGKNAKRSRKIAAGWTMKIKGEVLDELERMAGINRKGYQQLIDGIAERYAKLQHIDRKDVEKMARELKSHWKHISANLAKNARERGKKRTGRRK